MANTINGNSIYIDTAAPVAVGTNKNIRVLYIVLTASGGSALLDLGDDQTAGTVAKISLGVATDGETKVFDFSRRPLVFPNGIDATTVTNAKATLVLDRSA